MPNSTNPPIAPLPHENDNQEQDDEASQAQTVADEARGRHGGDPSEDSERGGTSDPAQIAPDDAPDLVDTMNQMVSSGQLDFGAFAGEPVHDDEEESYGDTGDEDAD